MHQRMPYRLDSSPVALLYQRHAPALLLYVRRHVLSWEDAEDIVLDVFLAALEKEATLAGLDDERQVAWLRRVAHNKVVDGYRRSRKRAADGLDEIAGAIETIYDDEAKTPEAVVLRHEEHALLQERLASLPRGQQEILQLRFAAGLRCSEIARLLNKREGTVRSILSRTLNFLRTIYEKS